MIGSMYSSQRTEDVRCLGVVVSFHVEKKLAVSHKDIHLSDAGLFEIG